MFSPCINYSYTRIKLRSYIKRKPNIFVLGFLFILNILISIYFFKSIGFIIIPIATTISSWFNLIILFLFLKKRNLFSFNNIFIKRFFKIVFSSILMGLFFNYLMIIFNEQLSFENSLKSFYLIMSVILGLGFYLLTSYLIKAFQLEDIKLRY